MKVTNKGNIVVNVVLASGPVSLQKGDSVEMPKWVFDSLKPIFPGLECEKEQVVVNAEPVEVKKPETKATVAHNGKSKKSRK